MEGPRALILRGNGSMARSAGEGLLALHLESMLECRPQLSALDLGLAGVEGARSDVAPRLLRTLASNRSLVFLDITGHGIGDSGATLLAEALRANKTLAELRYDENGVAYNGWSQLHVAVQANTTLRRISYPTRDFARFVRRAAEQPLLTAFIERAAAALRGISARCKANRALARSAVAAAAGGGGGDPCARFCCEAEQGFAQLGLREAQTALPDRILEKHDTRPRDTESGHRRRMGASLPGFSSFRF